jgi:hypothetical protein
MGLSSVGEGMGKAEDGCASSLSSPMFQGLGPDARALLEVVAFFPQGVNENNFDWLFPAISDVSSIFDTFCVLSLTCRNDGLITMLAPLRDYIGPKDPRSSPLLCATRERYFFRLSVDVYPDKKGSEETKWIIAEDVNVEHLLDAFMPTRAPSTSGKPVVISWSIFIGTRGG